jgi:hypothetical protein
VVTEGADHGTDVERVYINNGELSPEVRQLDMAEEGVAVVLL